MPVSIAVAMALMMPATGSRGYRPQLPSPSPVGRPPSQSKNLELPAEFVGDTICQSCHAEKVETFHHTSHYLTSRLPEEASIHGSFAPGDNVMKTSNPDLFFRMEEKGGIFSQTAVEGVTPFVTSRSERFAFVIGSGGKGQTYLFWKGDDLFQLPVSYWTELGWVNSPGYRDGEANFGRPILPRCLECHATYFVQLPPPPNRYSKTGFVVGITCEKCHGPGRPHVQRYSGKRGTEGSPAILNPARFPRDRQIELCALCHAGHGLPVEPAFSYLPGQQLDKYVTIPQPDPTAPIDVHGSQVEMLERSRCFQRSEMTCLTCHDVHVVQHDLAEFSRRCLSCHQPGSAMFPKKDHQTTSNNCIDCHMPVQATNLIVFDQNGKRARPRVRNHVIRVYSEVNPPAAGNH